MAPTNPNLVSRLLAKEIRRRKRREWLTYAVMWLVLASAGLASSGWCLMLAVTVIHRAWIPAVPGLGFWWSVLLVVLLRGALLPGRSSNRAKEAK